VTYRPIYEYFLEAVQKSFNRTALKYKKDGKYRDITYAELSRAVDEVANALTEMGVTKGDRVAIFSYNRPAWVMCDLAALKLGAWVIPIYHTSPAATVRYILKDSEARVLFVEKPELFKIAQEAIADAPRVKHVITFFDTEPGQLLHTRVDTFTNVRRSGSAIISHAAQKPLPIIDAQDVATVVYTSGTTGEPKGVMLTHANIMSNVLTANEMFSINQDDVFVSFLPLCHAFERTCGYYTIITAGGIIAYVESLDTLAADVKEVRPTVLISVPRMLEKVYEVASQQVESGSAFKRGMVYSAIRTFNRYTYLKDRKERIPPLLKLQRRIFKSLVVDKFHEIAGGRLRVIVSGAAPLARRLARVMHNLEFDVAEGYGLTECAPIVAAATPEHFKIGSVGVPLKGVEVRIGENSEVLVRGPNVMKGYLNRPEETARMIDNDGWLHTGDQGKIDEEGYLTITGRIKELIVTSYGKNVAPTMVEGEIQRSPYVEQVMVYGDRCSYLTALVVPRKAVVESYARNHGIRAPSYPELLKNERISKLIEADVVGKTSRLAPFEQVKTVMLVAEPFTIQNDMMTPTLKLRRNKIVERWKQEIVGMYQAKPKPACDPQSGAER
jgi:long-chain acyl-CoA synthetase